MEPMRAAAGLLAAVALAACRPAPGVPDDVRAQAALQPGVRTARASSWDRTGGNRDCTPIDAGATLELARVDGAGAIRHLYIGTTTPGGAWHRELVLRMYWDGGRAPCVEVPFGDFFLTAWEAYVKPVQTAMVVVNPGMAGLGSYGYHAYFAMPFAAGARVTVENQGKRRSHQLCYQVEYETYASPLPADLGRFHAQWRRATTSAAAVPAEYRNQVQWPGRNRDGARNYAILEAEGAGHLAGLHLAIDNAQAGWYGEGDEMIFVDGEPWPPRYHGTGTEEIFGGGATPNAPYTSPYSGYLVAENRGGKNFAGKSAMYRWYAREPVRFSKSILWTVEHGHANNFENDYTSVAYWYQSEPHKAFPALPAAADRLPRMPEEYTAARAILFATQEMLPKLGPLPPARREALRDMRREGYRLFHEGKWKESLAAFQRHEREASK